MKKKDETPREWVIRIPKAQQARVEAVWRHHSKTLGTEVPRSLTLEKLLERGLQAEERTMQKAEEKSA